MPVLSEALVYSLAFILYLLLVTHVNALGYLYAYIPTVSCELSVLLAETPLRGPTVTHALISSGSQQIWCLNCQHAGKKLCELCFFI